MVARLGNPIWNPGTAGRGVRPRAPALRPASVSPRGDRLAGAPRRRRNPLGPRKLNPNWSSGAPNLPAAPGRLSARGVGCRAPAPASQSEQRRSGEGTRPPLPRRAGGRGAAGGGQPCPVAVRASRGWAARGRGQSRGPRPGLSAPAVRPGPGAHSNLKSWSHPSERACLHLLAAFPPFFPSRPFRDLSWSKESKESPSLLSRSPRAAPVRRRCAVGPPCRAGAGQRLGGPEPSLRTAGARLPSLAQRTNHPRSWDLSPPSVPERPPFSDPGGKATFPPTRALGPS